MAKQRLYFIDALRAWAILMMLQGHFIDGLLSDEYRVSGNLLYETWKFFRGITAPVFFTVSGFIIVYLLESKSGRILRNPRIRKGILRGVQLIAIGYLLRLYIPGLLQGKLFPSFFYVDVLHCIGFSLIVLIGIYILNLRLGRKANFWMLIVLAVLIFITEPLYAKKFYEQLPRGLANYLTVSYGSVFTLIPWVGYSMFGGSMALAFLKYQEKEGFYRWTMGISSIVGLVLILGSTPLFLGLHSLSGAELYLKVAENNYLFIRLGHVLITLAFFVALRRWLTHPLWVEIGQSTLNIYIVHFVLLYGSFTGISLYRMYYRSLDVITILPSVLLFIFVCVYAALKYKRLKDRGYTLSGLTAWIRSKFLG